MTSVGLVERPRHVVAVGASAGGVEALQALAAGLPEDLPDALLVVLHTSREAHSALPQIVDRAGPLPAMHARHGEPLRAGRIYVGVPDRQLSVADGRVLLIDDLADYQRHPAINPLMRAVARAYGSASVGVLLSGVLDDGVLGLAAIHECGGTTIVQEPAESEFSDMPLNALAGGVDHVVAAGAIGKVLAELGHRGTGPTAGASP
jgi:two-component system, chemotaxis family, protein-glutamate methylesterase/glutaminase